MREVLNSIWPVLQNSSDVFIDQEAIKNFCQTIKEEEFHQSEYSEETILKDVSEEVHTALVFIHGALNFCYWEEPKWCVLINNQKYTGSSALIRVLKKAIENGYPLFNTSYLSRLPEKDLRIIFQGNVEIPLFQERLELLRELGEIITQKYDGSFKNIVNKSNGDAIELVKVLVADFPSIFNDEADYNGKKVKFYKRAQLIAAYLYDVNQRGIISQKIDSFEKITAFADYKVPQVLRKFDILKYSPDLATKVDNKIELLPGSKEEIEIRANTIWAVELMTEMLKKIFLEACAAKVDGIIWFRGQMKFLHDKPCHRTRTIWY